MGKAIPLLMELLQKADDVTIPWLDGKNLNLAFRQPHKKRVDFLEWKSVFIILVCCQTSFAADEAIPDWVSKPPTQDAQYWYFVGRSSGDAPEDKLYEQAYENAKITAIRELFGTATEVSSQFCGAILFSTSLMEKVFFIFIQM